MNHSNYLHKRIRISRATREDHDRAFLQTLIVLAIIIVIGMIVDQAWGQDEPKTYPQSQTTTTTAHQPKKVEPEVNSKTPEAPAAAAMANKSAAAAAAATKAGYQPTVEQAKDLRLAQLEAINAQNSWNAAALKLPEYQTFQTAVNAIYAVCARVKTDNKLPADIGCNINVNPITFEKIPAQASASPLPPPTPTPATAVPEKPKENKK
jgi:hypothetical protein